MVRAALLASTQNPWPSMWEPPPEVVEPPAASAQTATYPPAGHAAPTATAPPRSGTGTPAAQPWGTAPATPTTAEAMRLVGQQPGAPLANASERLAALRAADGLVWDVPASLPQLAPMMPPEQGAWLASIIKAFSLDAAEAASGCDELRIVTRQRP